MSNRIRGHCASCGHLGLVIEDTPGNLLCPLCRKLPVEMQLDGSAKTVAWVVRLIKPSLSRLER
jgi:hypothetical protein